MHRFRRTLLPVLAAALCSTALWAGTPAEQLSALAAQAGRSPNLTKGQQFFNATHGREWSCASCHNDGGDDGRTWDLSNFGEGLRNTVIPGNIEIATRV